MTDSSGTAELTPRLHLPDDAENPQGVEVQHAPGSANSASTQLENVANQSAEEPDANLLYRSLSDWLDALQGPDPTVFKSGALFGPEQFAHLFRILIPSVAIVGAEFGVAKLMNLRITQDEAMIYFKIIACFGYVSFLFSFYSRLFGVKLNMRQSFFCFAMVVTPWFPMIGALRLVADEISGILYILSLLGMLTYMLWAVSCSVRLVSGRSQLRVFACIVIGVGLVAACNVLSELPSVKQIMDKRLHSAASADAKQ
jgi:hypothetical protein